MKNKVTWARKARNQKKIVLETLHLEEGNEQFTITFENAINLIKEIKSIMKRFKES